MSPEHEAVLNSLDAFSKAMKAEEKRAKARHTKFNKMLRKPDGVATQCDETYGFWHLTNGDVWVCRLFKNGYSAPYSSVFEPQWQKAFVKTLKARKCSIMKGSK